MENAQIAISLVIVLVTSGLLIVTGLKKQPGIGVIGTVVIIGLTLWLRNNNIKTLGFDKPSNWGITILLGLGLGFVVQIFSVVLFEPLSEKITKTSHDHSVVENVKGSWKAFLQWLIIVWVLVAILEEGIYRGFLMTEIAKITGVGVSGLIINVIFTSIVFGLSHGYQSRSGILSTGIVGLILGIIFVISDLNLWLAIFTHGFIDTIGIGLIAVDGDKYLRGKFWKSQT